MIRGRERKSENEQKVAASNCRTSSMGEARNFES